MGSFRIELEDDHLKEITGKLFSRIYKHEIILNSKDGHIKFNIFSDEKNRETFDLNIIQHNFLKVFPVKSEEVDININLISDYKKINQEDLKKNIFDVISGINGRTLLFRDFCRDVNILSNDIIINIGKKYFNTINPYSEKIKKRVKDVLYKQTGFDNWKIVFEPFDDSEIFNKMDAKRNEPEVIKEDKTVNKTDYNNKNNSYSQNSSKPKTWSTGKKNFKKNYQEKNICKASEGDFVQLKGKIIFYDDIRNTKSGKFIHTLVIKDNTGALIIKSFSKSDKKVIDEGEWSIVKGQIKYDDYIKEQVLWLDSVEKTEPERRVDNYSKKRVELHCHTKMSMDDAVADITEMVELAAFWGHKALAITDHGVVQGFPVFYKACKANNIKPVFGMEGYLYVGDEEKFNQKGAREKTHHIIILVKNDIGRKNLYKLVSYSHINNFYYKPLILESELAKYREGLILGSACEAGELFTAILNKKEDEIIKNIALKYDFLEIQPITNNMFLVRDGKVPSKQTLIDINQKIVDLGEELGKPVVATCDSHFIEPQDGEYRKILLANKGFKDFMFQPELYFRTTNEMIEEFAYLGKEKAEEVCIDNPNKIVDEIEEFKPIPDGFYPPSIDNAEEMLVEMVYFNAKERYGEKLPEVIEARLKLELDSIIKYQFSTLFYLAHLIVKKSLDDGYIVGSRGSVGSSVVARFSNVTEVNPLPAHYICKKCKFSEFFEDIDIVGVDLEDKNCPQCGEKLIKDGFNIPFQVFMGFFGDKVPDIDLNFSGEYQSKIHKYVEELFGETQCFKAGTISVLKAGQCGMYLNKYMESLSDDNSNTGYKGIKKSEEYRMLKGIEGVKKTTGQHPGGVIVVPTNKEIFDFSPINFPANKKNSGVVTTHFDYHVMDAQLVKLDMLGHDDPTIIKHLVEMTNVNIFDIPLDDKETMSLFTDIKSTAIPEFGTSFVKRMLEDTNPTKFTELIRISGLSHGTDVWTNNAQELIRQNTCDLSSVISVRDDIMNYLINKGLEKKASFDIMEHVRKGKGLKPEMEQDMKKHKVPEWYIGSCKKIKYMFPKAHAVAYVVMAYRIAWFKVNYPREFYSAYFGVRAFNGVNSTDLVRGKSYIEDKIATMTSMKELTHTEKSTVSYLEVALEAIDKGIKFIDIDLNKSDYSRFNREGENMLRCPLIALDGLGEKAAMKIVEERLKKPFRTQEDLAQRCSLNKNVMSLLKEKGCMDEIPECDTLMLF
ncbi:MAG: PolC-type DNA polymerase III [Candidatus Muirbacterium halophilum]|nr:PolC-type DNA polymerase III [Candidatus Muirbacterium halophilum]MCK9476276.1 PolC-type DNA polymerase III [Candidatus Muirbacterium halophilum]